MLTFLLDNAKYIAVISGFLAGMPIVGKRRGRLGLKRQWQTALVCMMFSVFSVLSAVIFAGFESVLGGKGFVFNAISTYGIYFICPFLIMAAAKPMGIDRRKIMDVYALYAMPSLFFLRINCLISGCCEGCRIGHTGFFWPTRELEMAFYALALLWLLRRERRKTVDGTAFPLLMAAYGAFRFAVEWMRDTEADTFFHLAHWWSLAAVIIGISVYSELIDKPHPSGKKDGERSNIK